MRPLARLKTVPVSILKNVEIFGQNRGGFKDFFRPTHRASILAKVQVCENFNKIGPVALALALNPYIDNNKPYTHFLNYFFGLRGTVKRIFPLRTQHIIFLRPQYFLYRYIVWARMGEKLEIIQSIQYLFILDNNEMLVLNDIVVCSLVTIYKV